MKRMTLLGGIVVAALAVSGTLSIPRPAHALLCCETGYTTAQYWAKGPTCLDAQAAYRALARPEADATCGGSTNVCGFTIPPCEDWAAEDPANPWKIDGIAHFGCKYECGGLSQCCTQLKAAAEAICKSQGMKLTAFSCTDTGPTSCEASYTCGY